MCFKLLGCLPNYTHYSHIYNAMRTAYCNSTQSQYTGTDTLHTIYTVQQTFIFSGICGVLSLNSFKKKRVVPVILQTPAISAAAGVSLPKRELEGTSTDLLHSAWISRHPPGSQDQPGSFNLNPLEDYKSMGSRGRIIQC